MMMMIPEWKELKTKYVVIDDNACMYICVL